MMRRLIIIYSITVFSLLSLNFQCGKDKELPLKTEEVINIEMLLDIYPVKKKYAVGDTIWIQSSMPDKILSDVKNHTKILADTIKFSVPFIFHVLAKQVLVPDGGFCEFINPQQLQLTTSSGYYDPRYRVYWNYNTSTIQDYGCTASPYHFKIGVKLKTKGAFYIGISGSQLKSCASNKATQQNRYLSFKFSTSDVNQEVYDNLPKLPENDPYRIGFNLSSLSDKKAFIVAVE